MRVRASDPRRPTICRSYLWARSRLWSRSSALRFSSLDCGSSLALPSPRRGWGSSLLHLVRIHHVVRKRVGLTTSNVVTLRRIGGTWSFCTNSIEGDFPGMTGCQYRGASVVRGGPPSDEHDHSTRRHQRGAAGHRRRRLTAERVPP